MSLTNIPKPEVIEVLDYETLLQSRKDSFIALAETYYQASGELDKLADLKQAMNLESEPLVKLLQESTYRELLLRHRINDAASAVMVPLAKGADLDNLAALYGIERGLLDPATPEGDDQFRQRLMLAPKSLSTAGSKSAYKFHALSSGNQADKIELQAVSKDELHVIYRYNSEKNLVKDATVESPTPCDIQVYVLGFDQYGNLDSTAISQVTEHLSDDKVRPLGDRVTVSAADIVLYKWQIKLHLSQDLEGSAQVELILKQVRDQLVDFIVKHHYLGKAIRQSTILGVVSPLIDGWIELTLYNGSTALPSGQNLILTGAQAPHYDLSGISDQLDWQQRLEQAVDQSLEVVFDG